MIGTIIAAVLIALLAAVCAGFIHRDFAEGNLCDCSGECASCRIKCRSNPNYYGKKSEIDPAEPDPTHSRWNRFKLSLQKQYFKYFPGHRVLTFIQNLGMGMMLIATALMLVAIVCAVFRLILLYLLLFSVLLGMIGSELNEFAEGRYNRIMGVKKVRGED